jgi:ABC-2 type transport system ATP-binding protein
VTSAVQPTIQARDLRKSFGENNAVDGIDLDVAPGEIYGFLGPNGAGKSTTVKMLCTLLTPSSGCATVAGFDVATQPGDIRLRIGVALQDSSIDGKQTGRELLDLQGRLYGLRPADIKTRMDDVIGLVDIGTAIDDRVESYSGGMKRRLDLAMSLIHRPQILFLDEPTTGLDPASRSSVWAEVRRLNEAHGVTIFLTTQYLEEADELADRVGIISDGKIEAEGTPTELKRSIGTDLIVAEVHGDPSAAATALRAIDGVEDVDIHGSEVSIATPDGSAVIADVAVALNGCGVPVKSLTLRTPTLDDVFLQVTGTHLSDTSRSDRSGDGTKNDDTTNDDATADDTSDTSEGDTK